MSYKIIGKYIKDLNFNIPNPKTFFLLSKEISNYKININITSKQVKENIIEVLTTLNLSPVKDVSEKEITSRSAKVSGKVVMKKETLDIIKKGELAKGDIFTLSRTAGITAAKSTPTLIPLCHTIPLSEIKIEIEPDEELPGLNVICTTKADWKTGVEIEAFTGVSIACVTIYDMCKAVDKSAYITDIKLIKKFKFNILTCT